ncbi:MAG: hypothetical protein NVSMB48_09250 [Marmoricola sp.]
MYPGGSSAVERELVGLVERRPDAQALGQVRVGEERPAEGDGVDQALGQKALRLGYVVGSRNHDRPVEGVAEPPAEVVVDRRSAGPVRLGEMQVGDAAGGQLRCEVASHERAVRVGQPVVGA